jgi:hypothetical protein
MRKKRLLVLPAAFKDLSSPLKNTRFSAVAARHGIPRKVKDFCVP